MAKFKIGDYVCTMYEGQYVYGSILDYYQKKYTVLLDDGRKIKISESTWCVKSNPLKY